MLNPVRTVRVQHSKTSRQILHQTTHPLTKQVKVTDFSLSSRWPQETLTLVNPNALEGNLAYISPEQTGRMNRFITGLFTRDRLELLKVTLISGGYFPRKCPIIPEFKTVDSGLEKSAIATGSDAKNVYLGTVSLWSCPRNQQSPQLRSWQSE